MSEPQPVYKGLFMAVATGKRVFAYFLKHNPDAGETADEDCFLTVSDKLTGGERGCGESGLWPVEQFKAGFRFIGLVDPAKPFGA